MFTMIMTKRFDDTVSFSLSFNNSIQIGNAKSVELVKRRAEKTQQRKYSMNNAEETIVYFDKDNET